MTYNDLSECNCCPPIADPCECATGYPEPVGTVGVPCCFRLAGNGHCGYTPSDELCRGTKTRNYSPGNIQFDTVTECQWVSQSTYAFVEVEDIAGVPQFPQLVKLFWALIRTNTNWLSYADSPWQVRLCFIPVLQTYSSVVVPDPLDRSHIASTIAIYEPRDLNWDPMFQASTQAFDLIDEFTTDSRFEALGFGRGASIINCAQMPGGTVRQYLNQGTLVCDTRETANSSNLPQSVTVFPSCYSQSETCYDDCEDSGPAGCHTDFTYIAGCNLNDSDYSDIGCGECSSNPICPTGDCTWDWNATDEVWEETSDCEGDCICIPLTCPTANESSPLFGGSPSITTLIGECYDPNQFTNAVQACDSP